MSSRAGSHAGRGFRYQDAVAGLFAVGCWTGRLPYGAVTPEGQDDFELAGKDGSAFVQVKSRRDHLGLFPANDVANYVKELWDRYDKSRAKPDRLLLVLERPVNDFTHSRNPEESSKINTTDVIGKRLKADKRNKNLLSLTRISVHSSPRENASAELSAELDCQDLLSWIYYGVLLTRVGELSDQNGMRKPGSFVSLTISDVQREIDVLSDNISPEYMEAALQQGLCEAVDFLTPLNDPYFYLGVDVQPGHIAAGLVAERPDARKSTINALEDRRNVVIAGPSGSGKSALMWEAARTVRHVVRWFRVRRLPVERISLLLRLARSFRPSTHAPVGFVFDDIGRGLTDGWDAMSREAAHEPGLVLLGSAREEDLFPMVERERAMEIRETGDNELAERLWTELRQREQTSWPGWREPWRQSKKLLLEYTHLLTSGERLTKVLRGQVSDRARDTEREAELAVLRVVSAAGSAGATVDVERLSDALKLSEERISRALRRLFDEHLIREAGPGRIGGLHQLRSTELFRLCHEFPPPTQERTIVKALNCVAVGDIEVFVVRNLEINSECQTLMVNALSTRLNMEPDPTLAASALRGLGQVHISASVCEWLEQSEVKALPRTQVTIAASLGFLKTDLPESLETAASLKATRLFRSIMESASKSDPRRKLFSKLTSETIETFFKQKISVKELNSLLCSTIGSSISRGLRILLTDLRPNLLKAELTDITELLGTARLVDPIISEAWVDSVGQKKLLNRIERETPWVSCPEIRQEEDGLAACCDVRFVSASRQLDVHEEVVRLCRVLLGIVPDAQLAISKAVSADGELAGHGKYPIASKRIPRENLPPYALPGWNRQWWTTVADRVAAPNYTDYLAHAIILIRKLLPILKDILNDWFHKAKVKDKDCDTLNQINNVAGNLTPPSISPRAASGFGNDNKNETVTNLQSVLFDCSVNLIKRFHKLPDQAGAYIVWASDILKRIDGAVCEEPWQLVADNPPKELMEIRQIVEELRLMAGEANALNRHPLHIWRKRKVKLKNAFRLAILDMRRSVRKRLVSIKAEIERALDCPRNGMDIYVRIQEEENTTWPPVEVLITIPLKDVSDWPFTIEQHADKWRSAVGSGRYLTCVPIINDVAVDHLTIKGIKTLFPQSGKARAWLEQEGVAVLDDVRTQAFAALIDPLIEISGMNQFGYGRKERPVVEREALNDAHAKLKDAMANMHEILSVAQELLTRITVFVNDVMTGEVLFAKDMITSLRGDSRPSFEKTNSIQNELTRLDLGN